MAYKTERGAKIAAAMRGRTLSPEHKEKLRIARLGRHIHTEEHKAALRKQMQGNTFALGHKLTQEEIEASSATRPRGANHYNWKGGVTKPYRLVRTSYAYTQWRTHVFQRDDYRCQRCGVRGGVLVADHELPFAFYPDLRLEVLNGRTFCDACHKLTDTFANPINVYG